MTDSTRPLYCFPDTNTLIHFETFDEVDWPKLLNASAVQLVLARSVVQELDKLKNDPSSDKRSKRARTINSKLKQILENSPNMAAAPVRDSVTLTDIVNTPRIDWAHHGLSSADMDDHLIASILVFCQDHPEKEVILVSNDFGVRRKALAHGLRALDPETFLDRIKFPSEEAKTIQRLTQENESLRRRIPVLQFGFVGTIGPTNRHTVLRSRPAAAWRTDEEIQQELDDEKESCLAEVTQEHWLLLEDQTTRYVNAVKNYVGRLEEFLRHARLREAGIRLETQFLLENSGSVPATDVEATIFVPEMYLTYREDHPVWGLLNTERPSRPILPELPDARQVSTVLAGLTPNASLDSLIPTSPFLSGYTPPLATEPRPDTRAFGRWITLFHPKLRAKEYYFSDPVVILVPPTTAGGFQLDYRVHADELTEPMTGRLYVTLSND